MSLSICTIRFCSGSANGYLPSREELSSAKAVTPLLQLILATDAGFCYSRATAAPRRLVPTAGRAVARSCNVPSVLLLLQLILAAILASATDDPGALLGAQGAPATLLHAISAGAGLWRTATCYVPAVASATGRS